MKLALILLAMFSFSAFSTEIKHTDLETLKLACKDPGSVHNQIPPSEIKVWCKAKSCSWGEAPTPGNYNSPTGTYKVCGAIVTNKPHIGVPKGCQDFGGSVTTFTCPIIEETCTEGAMDYAVTCDEVMGITDLEVWCQAKLAGEDPTIFTVTPTGRTINLCGGGTVVTPQDPGQVPTARPRQR